MLSNIGVFLYGSEEEEKFSSPSLRVSKCGFEI